MSDLAQDEGLVSALWNLMLYRLPIYNPNAKPEDLIPYRFCPHIPNEDTRYAVAYCGTHWAFMCGKCWSCHAYECRKQVR